jgi:altronate dehydratase
VTERHAVRLHPRDDVAVALQALSPGFDCSVAGSAEALPLRVAGNVPVHHKIALHDMPAGAVVHKYGEAIGIARTAIRRGEHVHVHNLASQRARG